MKKQIILTYLTSWIFFGILMLLTHHYHMDPNTFPAKLFLLAGGFAPSMVAILFFYNKWTGKKESSSFTKDLLKKILSSKSHVVFMVFIALILCSFLLASTFQS